MKKLSTIPLHWDLKVKNISSVVITQDAVMIQMERGNTFRFSIFCNKRLIEKLIENVPAEKVTQKQENHFDKYIEQVCNVYKQDKEEVFLRTRKREIVQSRQICMTLAKLRSKHTYKAVGRYFGDYDHATVLHSIKTVKNLLDTDKKVREDVGALFIGVKWPKFRQ